MDEKTPTWMKITKIKVKITKITPKFPNNNNNNWQVQSNAEHVH